MSLLMLTALWWWSVDHGAAGLSPPSGLSPPAAGRLCASYLSTSGGRTHIAPVRRRAISDQEDRFMISLVLDVIGCALLLIGLLMGSVAALRVATTRAPTRLRGPRPRPMRRLG